MIPAKIESSNPPSNHNNNSPQTAVAPHPESQCFPLPPSITNALSPRTSFEYELFHTTLPPPGPACYTTRRALWLAPIAGHPLPQEPSTSRQRLEQLLNSPGAVDNEQIWKAGVEKVWKGLVAGGRLKRRLPMNLVIKIIHAGWLRDPDTWPVGAVAPEPDDFLEEAPMYQPITREYSEGVTPAWTAINATIEDGMANRRASGMVVIE